MNALLKVAAVAALVAPCIPAAAQIYKCPDANGRTVIQQLPCAGGGALDVKPASGHVQPRVAPVDSDGKPMTEAQRIEANTQASMRHRRLNDLRERIVPGARSAVYSQRAQCERTQAALRDDQYAYKQNLYGKTHAAQRASELAAAMAECDTRDRALVTQFNSVLEECRGLGGCADVRP